MARGRVIRFGTSADAEFRAEAIEERGIEGSEFDFVSPGGRTRLELPLIGRHNVMNALAALAAASVWGIGADEAKRSVSRRSASGQARRSGALRGRIYGHQRFLQFESHGAGRAGGLLAATPGYRRRILAAGEMLELGDSSPELHRECGRAAAALGKIDWIFGVQGNAADFVDAAIEAGHPAERTRVF